jgi:hypothetical protein
MPQIDLPIALAGCAATCTAYAVLLSTKRGQKFTLDHTWVTVVVGVLIVLGWISTQGAHDVLTDLLFFAAGGAPMIGRSLWLYWRNQQQLVEYLRSNRQAGE